MNNRSVVLTNARKIIKQVLVVDNLSLAIKSGGFFSLLGSNGAGKSTIAFLLLLRYTLAKDKFGVRSSPHCLKDKGVRSNHKVRRDRCGKFCISSI